MAYVVSALAVLVGILAAALGITAARNRRLKEHGRRVKARAEEFRKNARELAGHHERVKQIDLQREEWNEKIRENDSTDILGDVLSANNNRVPDNQEP